MALDNSPFNGDRDNQVTRHSHIHFPAGNNDAPRPGPSDAESSRDASPLRKSVVKEGASAAKLRRSVDGAATRSDRLRSKTLPSRLSVDIQPGISHMKGKREQKGEKGRPSIEVEVFGDERKHGAFSDEYDLCE
jgi:hypothetical protein